MTLRDLRTAKAGVQFLNETARANFALFQALVHPTVSAETYVEAVHLQALAWKLQQVAEGKIRKLLVAIAPRHFKSFQSSVALPCYLLGRDPTQKIICASYGSELADKFASDSRLILQSQRYRQIFPQTVLSKLNPPLHNLRTTQGGYRYATSVGGTLTGFGADIVILDDPIKAAEASSQPVRDDAYDWLKSSAMTRFDKPGEARVIVVMQRLHNDDVIGRLKMEEGWDLLELPAQMFGKLTIEIGASRRKILQPGDILFPQRFDEAVLEERRKELGEAAYNAQYLQRPVALGHGLFKIAKCPRFDFDAFNKKHLYEALIVSLDPGVSTDPKADYSAMTLWGLRGPDFFLLKAERGQWDFSTQVKKVEEYRKICDAIVIERSHTGILLLEHLAKMQGGPEGLKGVKPLLAKNVRAEAAALTFEKGRVHLPIAQPWLDAYVQELAEFPQGKKDDWVDSTSQAIMAVQEHVLPWLNLSHYKSGWS